MLLYIIIILLLLLLFATIILWIRSKPNYITHCKKQLSIPHPISISGGNQAETILSVMMEKRYEALHQIFLDLNLMETNISYEQYKTESPNHRNEVGYFISKSNKNISHHYPGDSFADTLQNMQDYYILDDVIGFNNLLGARKLEFRLNVPPFFNNYVLVGYIDKYYKSFVVDYKTYQYPTIIPEYNYKKKSYPYYMHAFYKKIDSIPTIETSNEYLSFIIPKLKDVSPKLYVPQPVKTFPHYGADCVFNSLISLLCFRKDDLIKEYLKQGKNYELVRLLSTTDHTYTTQKLEAEFGQEDISKPYDIKMLFESNNFRPKFFAEPYIMFCNNLNNISNHTKYVIAYVHEASKYSFLKCIGMTLVVSRIGSWNNFFHQIAYNEELSCLADDMTYYPEPLDRKEIDDMIIYKSYGMFENLNYIQ